MLPRARLVLLVALAGCPPPNALDFPLPGKSTSETSGSSGEGSSGGSSGEDSSSSSGGGGGGSSSGDGSGSAGMSTGEEDTSGGQANSTDAETTGTTGQVAVCGDGVLGDGEECDEGGDSAECTSCFRTRRVFATSMLFSPGFAGIEAAVGYCRTFAAKGKLKRAETFEPWLSDSQSDAIDRVWHGDGKYVRVDGEVIADNFAKLLAGPLKVPINVDEYGKPAPGGVMTGTRPDGTAVPDGGFCNDWHGTGPFEKELWKGSAGAVDGLWTLNTNPETSPGACSGEYRLYCFEGK